MRPVNVKKYKGSYFKILQETRLSQSCIMTLRPKGNSGPEELHKGDQIIYIIEGSAEIEIGKQKYICSEGELITVPKMTRHHIYNRSTKDVLLLTIYTPPEY